MGACRHARQAQYAASVASYLREYFTPRCLPQLCFFLYSVVAFACAALPALHWSFGRFFFASHAPRWLWSIVVCLRIAFFLSVLRSPHLSCAAATQEQVRSSALTQSADALLRFSCAAAARLATQVSGHLAQYKLQKANDNGRVEPFRQACKQRKEGGAQNNTLPGRLELPTLRLKASRSNQLS